jgi:hypothetical protein
MDVAAHRGELSMVLAYVIDGGHDWTRSLGSTA